MTIPSLEHSDLAAAQEKIRMLEKRVAELEADSVTAATILTRPEFNREVARMLALDERYGGTSSVIYFDLEGLERASSAIIMDIGAAFIKNVRSSDVIGRLAPAEFGVLLIRCDNATALKKADELGRALHKILDTSTSAVTIAYGAYTFQDSKDIAGGLHQAAQMVTKILR